MAVPRIHWPQLPSRPRAAVEVLTGPVLSATTAALGENSAVATILDTEERRVFVKGLPTDHRGVVAQQREAAINPHVRAVSPALLWRIEIDGWDLLCFEYIEGRSADYTPGSADLPQVAATMSRLAALPCPDLPPAYFRPAELRWAGEVDEPERQRLFGNTILHTDYNPSNVLVGADGSAHIVDWAWPTRGAAWIDPACLVLRLIAHGHSPAGAEEVVQGCPAWVDADGATIDFFVSLLTSLWDEIARDQPGEPWKQRISTSAHRWQAYRSARVGRRLKPRSPSARRS